MNKRKILTLALSLCMIAILAIGGTLAYFVDSDSDKNVMTVGNVSIDQIETFNPDKEPLMPGEYIEKNVNVLNDGTQPAYIRTIIAFENTNPNNDNGKTGIASLMEFDHDVSTGEFEWFVGTELDCLKIGDKYYSIGVQTYQNPVAAGEYAGTSLEAVRLQTGVDQADIEAAGFKTDSKYEILVLSQATQTTTFSSAEEALNAAFGEISVANKAKVIEWLKPVAESQGIETTTPSNP